MGFPELGRLLHNEGTRGYTNDNILDVIGSAINGAEGDFWVFQAHLFEKFTRQDGVERWINRSIKKWEKKFGKKHFPRLILIPFAVTLHYRLYVWNTHMDKVVYIDPFNPH